MGYVNLSIYMGKTSKKVLGPKDVNVGQTNIVEPRNLNCFTLLYFTLFILHESNQYMILIFTQSKIL